MNGPAFSWWHFTQTASCCAADLGHALLERAVRIVAVRALHQALIHLVMERLGEGGLYVLVALFAKRLLRCLQELRIILRAVNAVA